MRKMLEEKLARFEELEGLMQDPAILENSHRMAAVAREHGSLAKLATKFRRFKSLNEEIASVREMATSSDEEERELAEMELPTLKEKREAFWEDLLEMTIGGETEVYREGDFVSVARNEPHSGRNVSDGISELLAVDYWPADSEDRIGLD